MPKPKLIKTPEDLMKLFNDYKKEVKSKPFIVTDWVGGMGKMVQRKKEKPLTMVGFRVYCALQGNTVTDYFSNKEDRYSQYATICKAITESIQQDQIEGGMAGVYNSSITQRLNNLVERTQTEIVEMPLFPDA